MDCYKRKMVQLTRLESIEDVQELIDDIEIVRQGLKKRLEEFYIKNNELVELSNRDVIRKVKQDAMQD